MPFTPAHAAIVLPFLRARPKLISGTALIIGSTAPDFEYFLKMSVNSYYSHSLMAVFYFNIPITIVLSLLFHQVVKRNLINNLPAFFQSRFQPMLHVDFIQYFKTHFWTILTSAGIGSLSHIFWDSFTHNDGYFAQRISFYKTIVIPFDGVRYPLFYGLQQISTYVGLFIVMIYLIRMKPDRNFTFVSPSAKYWLAFSAIICAVLFLRFYFSTPEIDLGNLVVSTVSAVLLASIVCGLLSFKATSSKTIY